MRNFSMNIIIWAKAQDFSFLKPRPKGRGNYESYKFV
jgi:hypothetical protein